MLGGANESGLPHHVQHLRPVGCIKIIGAHG